jgi:hypothetical protein
VGAEEGARGEEAREKLPGEGLKLVRPEGPSKPAKPAPPKPWKAAASSVPRLKRVDSPAPGDKGRAAPSTRASEPVWAEPMGGRTGVERDASTFDEPPADGSGDPAEPFDAGDLQIVHATAPAAPAQSAVLNEPWWAIATDALQTNRMLQLGILAVLLATLAWSMWPRSQPSVSIHSIHEHPERFDGTTVRVKGRVGDVYEIGGAYAYYLEQGRDTIVVFSRTRRPYRNEKLEVAGSVSMGYLDGIARPSIFELVE